MATLQARHQRNCKLAPGLDALRRRVLGLIDTFGALAAGWLANGVKRGFIRPDLDSDSVGRALTSLTLPGVFAAIRGDSSAEERRRYIDAMVSLVCDGIATS